MYYPAQYTPNDSHPTTSASGDDTSLSVTVLRSSDIQPYVQPEGESPDSSLPPSVLLSFLMGKMGGTLCLDL